MHLKMINAGWDRHTLTLNLLCSQERGSLEASPIFLAKMRLSKLVCQPHYWPTGRCGRGPGWGRAAEGAHIEELGLGGRVEENGEMDTEEG